MTDTPHGWLVIQCKGGWEPKARRELIKRGFRVWLPFEHHQRMNRGTPTIRKEPAFPGYLFIAKLPGVSLEDIGIHAIRSTRGVLDVLGYASGNGQWTPAMLGHPDVIEVRKHLWRRWHQFRQQITAGSKPRRFEPGTEAEIITGPFAGRKGTIARLFVVSPKERITLLIDICGGRVPLVVPAAHVAQTATIMGGGSVSKRRQSSGDCILDGSQVYNRQSSR
jgi:transcription antitermination factor NusG